MNQKTGIPVVVTGFGPFGIHSVNVSWEIAKTLLSLNLESHGIHLILREIPVAYSSVNEEVPRLWKRHKPTLVIHLGLKSTGSEICVETVAHKSGYHKIDVFGRVPESGSANGKHEVLRTALNVQKVVEELSNHSEIDIPIQLSSNAGRYLCEFIFYTSLSINYYRTVFVHVPNIDKGYTVLQMACIIKEIILSLLEQVV